ncbi:putative thiamine biosynthesis protein [bacterium BMS3Bbin02]|nr:putative thiamine biosynthesis protein [bacterium BMS3Bbin02]
MTKRKRGKARLFGFVLVMALVAAACGGGTEATTTTAADAGGGEEPMVLTPITLQLQWFTQAQFAGYYAAVDQGFYEDLGLDVTIIQGGIDILPATVLDSGAADFAISWVPRGLVPREEGLNITNIAQIFERSATLQVSFKETGIKSVADLAGKTVGNWGFGNEFELLAGLRSAGLDPDNDVTLVQQQFDMLALISGEIDAAQAMIYNEYAQVLETINPDTGELFTADDLDVINWNDVGTAMLQDAIWADADRLETDAEYRANAVKFVEASMRGWIFCRDNVDRCVDIVLDAGPTLGESHQKWQMNEINGLIWPSSGGIGLLDQGLWDQTVAVATAESILSAPPTDGAFRTDIAQEALDNLKAAGVDVNGSGWSPITVELKPGGE